MALTLKRKRKRKKKSCISFWDLESKTWVGPILYRLPNGNKKRGLLSLKSRAAGCPFLPTDIRLECKEKKIVHFCGTFRLGTTLTSSLRFFLLRGNHRL